MQAQYQYLNLKDVEVDVGPVAGWLALLTVTPPKVHQHGHDQDHLRLLIGPKLQSADWPAPSLCPQRAMVFTLRGMFFALVV